MISQKYFEVSQIWLQNGSRKNQSHGTKNYTRFLVIAIIRVQTFVSFAVPIVNTGLARNAISLLTMWNINLKQKGTQEGNFHYIVKGVYSSGRSKKQQEKAREFLEGIGVCDVDEAERIKMILKQRYTKEFVDHLEDKQHFEDMKRFIDIVEDEPDNAHLFEDYCILKTAEGYLKNIGRVPRCSVS